MHATQSTQSAQSTQSKSAKLLAALAAATTVAGCALGALGATGAAAAPATGVITTVAGTGTASYSGDGSAATSATLDEPLGVAVDRAGDMAIADTHNNAVRFVPATSGTYFGRPMSAGDIYTVAGDGTPGYTGNGGPGTSAELWRPQGVAFDAQGDVIVADSSNNAVRAVVDSDGTLLGTPLPVIAGDIYTLAGGPVPGYSGDGGSSLLATLHGPASVAVDADGIAVADSENDAVRFIAATAGTFFGAPMVSGDIYTIAGTSVAGYNGDGRPAISAELDQPEGVALDQQGDLAIADTGADRVRVVPASSGTYFRIPMVAGDIYTVAGNGTAGYSGDGGPAGSAEVDGPMGVAFDGLGDLGVSDTYNHVVRFVPAASGTYFGVAMHVGDLYTIAGDGNPGTSGDGNAATSAELTDPVQLAFTGNDSPLFADALAHRVREVGSGWSAPTVTSAATASATVGQPFSFTATAAGSPAPYVSLTQSLPAGLSFHSGGADGTGLITGTPTAAGTVVVYVNAANGVEPAASAALTITVSPAPVVAHHGSPHCSVGSNGGSAELNPTTITGHLGWRVTIKGCEVAALKGHPVTALVSTPGRAQHSAAVPVSAQGTFRFVTDKLVRGTTVVTFKAARKVLFVTKIHTA